MKFGRDLLGVIIMAVALFAMTCSFPMTWFRDHIESTEGFVSLAEQAGHDQKLRDRITDEIVNTVDSAISLPSPVMGYVKPKIRKMASGLYETEQFKNLWSESMYGAHDKMLTPGGGDVEVNLAPEVKRSISKLGLPINLEQYVPADIKFSVAQIPDVPIIRTLSAWTKYIPFMFYGGILISLGALFFSAHRRIVLMIGGLLLLVDAAVLWISTTAGPGLLPQGVKDFPATSHFTSSYAALMAPNAMNLAIAGGIVLVVGFASLFIPLPESDV